MSAPLRAYRKTTDNRIAVPAGVFGRAHGPAGFGHENLLFWIAVSVYVLVAIVRKRLGLEASIAKRRFAFPRFQQQLGVLSLAISIAACNKRTNNMTGEYRKNLIVLCMKSGVASAATQEANC